MGFLKAITLVVGMFALLGAAMYFADQEMFFKTVSEVKGIVDNGINSFNKK